MKSNLTPRSTRILSTRILPIAGLLLAAVHAASAASSWNGVAGDWTDATKWTGGIPVSALTDLATFNTTSGSAGVQTLLNGDQSALGLVFNTVGGLSAIRSTVAGQSLTLGTSGITWINQLDLGGTGAFAMVVKLAGSQLWSGSSALIQLNSGGPATQESITNATATPVTLTLGGAGAGTRTIGGVINDGTLGGTTALVINATGNPNTNLFGANTYSGGTTLTQGILTLGNATALGAGSGVFTLNSTAAKTLQTNILGGVTLTNNNPMAWNGNFTLGGAQNINFGTGAITPGGATPRTITLNAASNPVNYTFGGNISGVGFGLTLVNQSSGLTNAMLRLDGTNTYDAGTTITGGLAGLTHLNFSLCSSENTRTRKLRKSYADNVAYRESRTHL